MPTTKAIDSSLPLQSPKLLPWLIGGVGALGYWLTLNGWMTVTSLRTISDLMHWSSQPEWPRPLTRAVFTPLRLLPDTWFPLTCNIITAALAGFVLVQLARSVAILRQDQPTADAMRQKVAGGSILVGRWAWLPPVFAALALGLQLRFWENATAATGEILSLTGFAFAFRCILEYRLTPQDRWLYWGATAFALGVTENWLMLGYAPLFAAAIIWVKGYGHCLNLKFLVRLLAFTALGLCVYLLVPLTQNHDPSESGGFWLTLRTYLGAQKHALFALRAPAFRLMILTAILPFLLLAVRWRTHTVQLADDTKLGVLFTKLSGHSIHFLLFVVSLWIALEPVFTPRQMSLETPWLVYAYPWALVAGYGVGYLLVFGLPNASRRAKSWPAAVAVLLGLLLSVTLIWKNFNNLRLTNGGALREFARQLYGDLPAGNVTVLTDEAFPALLLRAELSRHGSAKQPTIIDTRRLPEPNYRQTLARAFGAPWPEAAATNSEPRFGPIQMVNLITRIATNEPVLYLHPSSGLFLEPFVATPQGWLQQLTFRPATNSAPLKFDAVNEQRWEQRWAADLDQRAREFAADQERNSRWTRRPLKALRLGDGANDTAKRLGRIYSKALNQWAVQLRHAGQETLAAVWLERATAMDPDNLAAQINREYASRQRNGNAARLTIAWVQTNYPRLLAPPASWPEVINRGGPVDEPTFLLQSGKMYLHAMNPRQALDCFSRSAGLAPDWPAPQLGQAQCWNFLGNYRTTEALTRQLLKLEPALPPAALAQLLQTRAMALWRSDRTNEAMAFVEQFTSAYQTNIPVLLVAADLGVRFQQFEMEVRWRDWLVQLDPNRVDWLVAKGHAELRAKSYEAALRTLTSALGTAPQNAEARLFRAIAALQAGQLADAQRDYQALLKNPAHNQNALFGLGGIAWRQQDTNAMIQYYQAFLSNNASASPQSALATQRLKDLQDE